MKKLLPLSIPMTLMLFAISCKQSDKPLNPEELGMSSDTLAFAADRMQSYIDDGKLAGIAVRTIKNGYMVQDKRFGFADIENEDSIAENTIYRIFSMSKPITAVALMTLYDDGKFKLDDKVSDFIPEFDETVVYTPAEDGFTLEPQENEMTVRHLLTHTSGLTYGWEPGSYVDSIYNVTGVVGWDEPLADKIKQLAAIPLKYQPGTRWEYGLSIDVAGYLVEVMSGMTFDEYLSAMVFEPLGMDDTGFHVPEPEHSRLAGLYTKDEEGKLKILTGNSGLIDDEEANFSDIFKKPAILFSGGGGLVSTVDDYELFCRMLLNGGELNGVRILEESTVDMIMSDQLPEAVEYGEGNGYGLGGHVNLESGSYGWSGAASTSFVIDPSNDLIILAFTQFMPSKYTYSDEYKSIILRAVVK